MVMKFKKIQNSIYNNISKVKLYGFLGFFNNFLFFLYELGGYVVPTA